MTTFHKGYLWFRLQQLLNRSICDHRKPKINAPDVIWLAERAPREDYQKPEH